MCILPGQHITILYIVSQPDSPDWLDLNRPPFLSISIILRLSISFLKNINRIQIKNNYRLYNYRLYCLDTYSITTTLVLNAYIKMYPKSFTNKI